MKIYTRKGDSGQTDLGRGQRAPKDHPRIAAFGDIDEANAHLGLCESIANDAELRQRLAELQADLFELGATLSAAGSEVEAQRAARWAARIAALEETIDGFEAALPPLKQFILPGGDPLGAQLHLARTVVRRAERQVATLSGAQPVPPNVSAYLNRLSDLLFVMARTANARAGKEERGWRPAEG